MQEVHLSLSNKNVSCYKNGQINVKYDLEKKASKQQCLSQVLHKVTNIQMCVYICSNT